MSMPPWHIPVWDIFTRFVEMERIPHAFLVGGLAGLGKQEFALRLAQRLLCRTPLDGFSCGECRDCRLFAAGTHPDRRLVLPQEPSRALRTDQVRELTEWVTGTALIAAAKVAILAPAETMNSHSINALLKTLEEPTPNTYLILVSERPESLPATVLSRCQSLRFGMPNESDAVAWLCAETKRPDIECTAAMRAAGGAPIIAQRLIADGELGHYDEVITGLEALAAGHREPVSLAAAWAGWPMDLLFRWISYWTREKVRQRCPDLQGQAAVKKLFELFDSAMLGRVQLTATIRQELLLEDLLIKVASLTQDTKLPQ